MLLQIYRHRRVIAPRTRTRTLQGVIATNGVFVGRQSAFSGRVTRMGPFFMVVLLEFIFRTKFL